MTKTLKFTLILSIFSLMSVNLFAQNVNITPPAPATPSDTVVVPPQTPANPSPNVPNSAAFPSYTVTPTEDLNPYGLSSLDSSTEKSYRSGPGTFGTNTKRATNAEVNKDRIEKKKAELEQAQDQVNNDQQITSSGIERENRPRNVSSDYKKTKLISWTDEKGNVHVTNDIGNVPQRYMDSVEYR